MNSIKLQCIIIVLIFFYCCINGCNAQNKKIRNPPSSTNVHYIDIQQDTNGKADFWYPLLKQAARDLKLDSLELGYDSLQLRIWFNYSLARRHHLFIIKYDNNWNGRLITYIEDSSNNLTEFKVTLVNEEEIRPLHGWNNLIKKFSEYGLNGLENSCKDERGIDGTDYCFEIATRKNYRYFSFWSPELSNCKEKNNILGIIQTIEKEFGFKRLQH